MNVTASSCNVILTLYTRVNKMLIIEAQINNATQNRSSVLQR